MIIGRSFIVFLITRDDEFLDELKIMNNWKVCQCNCYVYAIMIVMENAIFTVFHSKLYLRLLLQRIYSQKVEKSYRGAPKFFKFKFSLSEELSSQWDIPKIFIKCKLLSVKRCNYARVFSKALLQIKNICNG